MEIRCNTESHTIITVDEWSLFYDLIIENVERFGAECFCEHTGNDEDCSYCRCKKWREDLGR